MSLNHPNLDSGLPAAPAGKTLRKRFLPISVAALAVLGVAMGVSFLGTTGATGVTVTSSGSSNYVFPVTSAGIPSLETAEGKKAKEAVEKLKFETAEKTAKLPSLGEPTLDTAGKVAASGDLALVDASTENLGSATELIVNVYVTNLSALGLDYSSFALPVSVYKAECTTASKCGSSGWSVDTEVSKAAAEVFMTNTEGVFSFRVKGGEHQFLDITMNEGGSYYVSSATAGELGPKFYFTAQAV